MGMKNTKPRSLMDYDFNTLEGRMRYSAENALRVNKDALDKFTERFKEDPAYAFDWSAAAFAAAARYSLGKKVAAWLDSAEKNKKTEAEAAIAILAELKRDLMSKAKFPSRSTSAPSNEMALNNTAALAEFIEAVEKGA